MKPLAFHVRNQANGSLTEQVMHGIQAGVHTGRFVPGERLPTLGDMSAELGVSLNTMRCAIARLSAAGLLEVRRRSGICVRSTHMPRFRAHVLYVSYVPPVSYYYAARDYAFLETLRKQEIHITALHISGEESAREFPVVQHVLATQPVTLAVIEGETLAHAHPLGRLLNKYGIRFVEVWARTHAPAAVDSLRLDRAPAYQKLVRHCSQRRVKKVFLFSSLAEHWISFRDAARTVGLQAKHEAIDAAPHGAPGQIAFERAGHSAIAKRLKRAGIKRGQTLIVSTDDYFTRGALMAFYQAGWQIPRDVQLATTVNYGHVPVTGQTLTRIEMYPVQDGAAMAQLVLRNLLPNHRRRKPLVMCPRFVPGKTTRPGGRADRRQRKGSP